MPALSVEIKRVKVTDLLTITRMAYDNMTGVDPQFTELVGNPLGRLIGYLLFPFYFGLSGEGYKAVHDGRIAGCAYLHLNKHSGYVFNVNVNHAYRRQGVGRQLMNHLEAVTRERGRHLMALQVEDSNTPAKRLYQELGYRAFHPHFLRYEGLGEVRAAESAVALEPLNRSWGPRFFGRYQAMERREGDGWAAKALADHREHTALSGKFWRCLLNGEEAGAAWQDQTNGRLNLTLALKPEFWGHIGESGLVKQLIDKSPSDRSRLDLFLSSSTHHQAAVPMFTRLGFKEMVQPRLLMVKVMGEGE